MDTPAGSSPPSMQEILASIKRIIADPAPDAERAPATPLPDTDSDDVLHLGEGPSVIPPGPAPPRIAGDAPLISGATHAASAQAMATLATVTIDPHAAPNTLDALVRELLRPMLKDWLDANLPDLVERVVTREVARLGAR